MSHYFSEKQESRLDIKKIKIHIKSLSFEMFTAPGVFSKSGLDKGTEVLIKNCIIKKNWHILDMGSGIGVVGIAMKLNYPETKILMTDINERAIFLCKKNIELNQLENIEARKSNIFSNIDEIFDSILVNPPQTAGKKICFEIIEKSKEHLKKGGMLQLVARHNKGGATLEKKMEVVFGNVKQAAKESGYRVYISTY